MIKPMEWVVIAVIAIVVIVAVIPITPGVHIHERGEWTQSMIMALAGSLERYRVDFDSYPPGPATGTADDGTLFKYLNGEN